jgi:hypothetical protein
LDIVVVANRHRPPLVTAALRDLPHRVVYTPDSDLPARFSPAREARAVYVKSHVGAFRCFTGHQLALAAPRAEHILVLEDDATPNRGDWMAVVECGRRLLGTFEVVSLHGRDAGSVERVVDGGESRFLVLAPTTRRRMFYRATLKYIQGSLAYLITAGAAGRFVGLEYRGVPVDHLLANAFTFAVAAESPFDHDRRHGSLVERPR